MVNPDDFRVPASDTKGHSARQWFRCIPTMARVLEQIIQSKQFPYRTKGDLLRHALHRHIGWLGSLEPMITVSGQVDTIIEVMRDEEMSNDFALVFTKMGERVSQHLQDGADREAIRLIMTVQSHVNKMPDGFWKDKYKKEMKKKYGNLLEKATKYKIGSIE